MCCCCHIFPSLLGHTDSQTSWHISRDTSQWWYDVEIFWSDVPQVMLHNFPLDTIHHEDQWLPMGSLRPLITSSILWLWNVLSVGPLLIGYHIKQSFQTTLSSPILEIKATLNIIMKWDETWIQSGNLKYLQASMPTPVFNLLICQSNKTHFKAAKDQQEFGNGADACYWVISSGALALGTTEEFRLDQTFWCQAT